MESNERGLGVTGLREASRGGWGQMPAAVSLRMVCRKVRLEGMDEKRRDCFKLILPARTWRGL